MTRVPSFIIVIVAAIACACASRTSSTPELNFVGLQDHYFVFEGTPDEYYLERSARLALVRYSRLCDEKGHIVPLIAIPADNVRRIRIGTDASVQIETISPRQWIDVGALPMARVAGPQRIRKPLSAREVAPLRVREHLPAGIVHGIEYDVVRKNDREHVLRAH